MTVAELIARLQALPQDMPVVAYADEWDRLYELPAPLLRTLYRTGERNLPFRMVRDREWRTGEEVVGDPFDAVVLGLDDFP